MGCSGSRSNKANEVAIVSNSGKKDQNDTKSNCKNDEERKEENLGTANRESSKPETAKIEKSSSLQQPTLETQVSTWLNSIFTSVKSHLIQKI